MATSQSLRTPLVNNAVSFLRDANTQQSPLEKRVEFLRAKGLTNEEMDEAFRQVGMSPAGGAASFQPTADAPKSTGEFFSVPVQPQPQLPSYQMAQQIQYPYGASYPYPPPQPVEGDRDWRDWFIMAVVSGSVMMGVYSVARKYLFPHLVPPPLPAFQQSQQDLQAQFDAIQKQLDEMSLQTESQTKIVETQRDEVTKAVGDVERALREMEEEGEKSKDELKEIREEVAHIRELVPKLIESSQAAATSTLSDVQQELKSLKALLLSRPQPFSPAPASGMSTQYPYSTTSSLPYGLGGTPGVAVPTQSSGLNLLSGRPSIPAWQLATRPASSAPPEVKDKEKDKDGEDLAASGVLVSQGEPTVEDTRGERVPNTEV
ncbi:peroxisomal membrane protein pex14 [Tulasnella sp. JGI-2019a]|nr:peroxisomal membrane protein pex14 [Tulasnella sp. JGI-2019a]KAG9035178.1 peroxisomal membrane protein pex14 [Tulasnella sp. JGI-2019a]